MYFLTKSHRQYLIPFIFLGICTAALAIGYISVNTHQKSPLTQPASSAAQQINQTTAPTPPVELTYPKPTDWKTSKLTSLDISLCLPPDWSYQKPNRIITSLEGKATLVTTITSFPNTSSGLLKDIYLTQKLSDTATASGLIPPAATVDQFKLNNLPAMFISLPGNPDVVVVPTGDNLYEFTAANISPDLITQEFQTNFYTMIGCLKPL